MLELTGNHDDSRLVTGKTITPPLRPPKHIAQLDGLRGIAIVLVMLFHMSMVPPIGMPALAWSKLCTYGGLGVDVFFVLSGFLITGILRRSLQGRHYFRNFYARRVLRIFPLYYALLGFAFLVLPRVAPSTSARYAAVNHEAIWYWLHLSNFSIARRGAFVHGIVDVSWSLSIEEQFYLLWPAIVFWLSVARLRWLCVALVALSVASRALLAAANANTVAIYTLTFCRFDGLAIGALIALTVDGYALSAIRILLARSLFVVCPLSLLLVLPFSAPVAAVIRAGGSYLFASALTGCAILAILATPKAFLLKPLEWRVLQVFGRYSYALYLFHYPITGVIRDFVLKPAAMPVLVGSSLPSQAFFYLVAASASLGVALLSWHLYEKHFLSLKRLFS